MNISDGGQEMLVHAGALTSTLSTLLQYSDRECKSFATVYYVFHLLGRHFDFFVHSVCLFVCLSRFVHNSAIFKWNLKLLSMNVEHQVHTAKVKVIRSQMLKLATI